MLDECLAVQGPDFVGKYFGNYIQALVDPLPSSSSRAMAELATMDKAMKAMELAKVTQMVGAPRMPLLPGWIAGIGDITGANLTTISVSLLRDYYDQTLLRNADDECSTVHTVTKGALLRHKLNVVTNAFS